MKEKVLIVEDQYVEANYLRAMLEKAGYEVTGIARSFAKAKEMILADKPGLVLLDIFLSGDKTGIDLAVQLKEQNIAFVYLSANSNEQVLTAAKATQPYGFLVKPFRERDLIITLEIAKYRHDHSTESTLQRETNLETQLKNIISSTTTWEEKLIATAKTLQAHIPFDYFAAALESAEPAFQHPFSLLRVGFDEYQTIGFEQLQTITGLSKHELESCYVKHQQQNEPALYNEKEFARQCKQSPLTKLMAEKFKLESHITFPVHLPDGKTFRFEFYSRRPDAYHTDNINFFNRIQHIWVRGIATMAGKVTINKKNPVEQEKSNGPTNGQTNRPVFDGIIGNSHLLLNVFDLIMQVAPSDTSVLILGESGTGKERIADCIHNLSQRKKNPLVKINCAALPATLIESELFGHEKGSFTGALEARTGKFEKADKGTIFLDEIGEMPLDLQAKLLRVLQEKEIERIGSRNVTKIDVRIIAATNRNLEKEVAEGRFRLDLYYRLNVFPVVLPALRERKEDIPLLIDHFIQYYNRKAGKRITGVSEKVLKNVMDYHFPGNIRELEHFIERSVLLAKGNLVEEANFAGIPSKQPKISAEDSPMKTIHEHERDYIITVLKKCNGRIWGPGGAAEILNIPPSTLKSKMKKLEIKKEYIGN